MNTPISEQVNANLLEVRIRAANLRQVLIELGLSVKGLAEKMGWSARYASMVVTGRKGPSRKTACLLESTLGLESGRLEHSPVDVDSNSVYTNRPARPSGVPAPGIDPISVRRATNLGQFAKIHRLSAKDMAVRLHVSIALVYSLAGARTKFIDRTARRFERELALPEHAFDLSTEDFQYIARPSVAPVKMAEAKPAQERSLIPIVGRLIHKDEGNLKVFVESLGQNIHEVNRYVPAPLWNTSTQTYAVELFIEKLVGNSANSSGAESNDFAIFDPAPAVAAPISARVLLHTHGGEAIFGRIMQYGDIPAQKNWVLEDQGSSISIEPAHVMACHPLTGIVPSHLMVVVPKTVIS